MRTALAKAMLARKFDCTFAMVIRGVCIIPVKAIAEKAG
jgi:hypothetical protein